MLASSRNLAAAEGPKRRAKTPAEEAGGGGPERYWQGKVRHPSVG